MANDMDGLTEHSPRGWFERARHEADKAVLAERRGKKEEMFLTYARACQSYSNTKMHPAYGDERKKDPSWAARVKDFREVGGVGWSTAVRGGIDAAGVQTYEAFLGKAKETKDLLKSRPIETEGNDDPSSDGSHGQVTKSAALEMHATDICTVDLRLYLDHRTPDQK